MVTYAADITDTGQYILHEAFTKVGHELETAQEDLIMDEMVINVRKDSRLRGITVPGNFHSPQLP